MPWTFDDESIDVLRYFNELKNHLMPYILDSGKEPMLRLAGYGNGTWNSQIDPTCKHLDMQYMLGLALLVAPFLPLLTVK